MRAPVLRLFPDEIIVDNFAGGGGASLGIELALGRSPDIAINHDPEAIAMHKANHPSTRHYTSDVWDVDPYEACRGRKVGLAWFSPDCTFHSKARGGKPFRDRNKARRRRGLAWLVVRWGKAVRPRVIILENVEEFADWGPLGDDGKPCPLRKGFTFRRWKSALENLGYVVDFREVSACDYGAPTTRKRLFLIARCDGQHIVWPEPTHGRGLLPYRTAAECIEWSLPTYSIFMSAAEALQYRVKRPLADNTMRRIARGTYKFVLGKSEPFIVCCNHGGDWFRGRGIREPMPTLTTSRDAYGLVAPFVTRIGQTGGGGAYVNDVRDPLTTITTKAEHLIISPFLAGVGGRKGQSPETGLDRPYHTITAKADTVMVAAFLAKHYGDQGQRPGSSMREPVSTVTAHDHNALITSHLLKLKGTCRDGQSVTDPLHTVQAGGNHYAEVRAFLSRYNGSSIGQMLSDPMSTLDTTDRLGLVTVAGFNYVISDIGMRMLAPRELYRAQGFPDTYIIDPVIERTVRGRDVVGPMPKDAQVRMCGNSVSPYPAAALARAQFEEQIEAVA